MNIEVLLATLHDALPMLAMIGGIILLIELLEWVGSEPTFATQKVNQVKKRRIVDLHSNARFSAME